MPALSFRTKLLAGMMLAVLCVSGATLVVTERSVQAAYEKIFRDKLAEQITYLPREQEARLSAVKQKCTSLARLVRFVAALQAGEAQLLYEDGRAYLKSELGEQSFLGFMDAEGHLLDDPAWKADGDAARARVRGQLSRLAPHMGAMNAQAVGYVVMDAPDQPASVQEIIVTPILDAASGQAAGALVLGFPFTNFDEEKTGGLDSGVWVDGRLFSRAIAEPTAKELSRLLPGEIAKFKMPREQFAVTVAGIPHRVFYTPLNPGSPLPAAYKVGLYSWQGALQARAELRTQILLVSSGTLVVGVLLCLLLAHNFSGPISALTSGTAEIQRGNFSVKIPVRSRDEIGRLTDSFNHMAEGLALKERYHSLLNMVTDRDVAQELISGKFTLGGERREASVLFCDIRGFTPLTQGMDPAEVIQMLNEHMTALANVVNEHHGIVDKFIGDCVMAVFGAPKSYGNDAENAARCALKMIAERRRLNETSRYKIDIGVGVASGPLVAGNMGSQNRLNYTVLGENVNLAARLCSVAGRMEVVVSAATLASLDGRADITPLADLKLKGFTGCVSAAKLHAVKATGINA